MRNWEFFYFLWDDPLFLDSTITGDPKQHVDDPEFIVLRREMRLLALERLYIKIETLSSELRSEKQLHREAQAREVWTINQFSKHVPADTAEQILIDRKVLGMDRDFSFERAITGS
jgi:hypothetical protein